VGLPSADDAQSNADPAQYRPRTAAIFRRYSRKFGSDAARPTRPDSRHGASPRPPRQGGADRWQEAQASAPASPAPPFPHLSSSIHPSIRLLICYLYSDPFGPDASGLDEVWARRTGQLTGLVLYTDRLTASREGATQRKRPRTGRTTDSASALSLCSIERRR